MTRPATLPVPVLSPEALAFAAEKGVAEDLPAVGAGCAHVHHSAGWQRPGETNVADEPRELLR